MNAHIHFRHRAYVSRELALNPMVQWMQLALDGQMPYFSQKQLPAPNQLTIYTTRPLGKMAAPIPELRRPKGYELPYGYVQPWKRVSSYVWRYWQ